MPNVIDHYKYWETEAIVADLDKKRNPFSVLCWNTGDDFNIGSAIRNANAFLAREVVIWPRRKWDRRGAVGTQNYTHFKHFKEVDDVEAYMKGSKVIAVENIDLAKPIDTFEWPTEHFFMVFGQECDGLPPEILDLCDDCVYIRQYGSVRSLNVGCASAIAMYDYTSKLNGSVIQW